jgi:hypothetical protein
MGGKENNKQTCDFLFSNETKKEIFKKVEWGDYIVYSEGNVVALA